MGDGGEEDGGLRSCWGGAGGRGEVSWRVGGIGFCGRGFPGVLPFKRGGLGGTEGEEEVRGPILGGDGF